MLPAASHPYFRLDRLEVRGAIRAEAGFAVIVVEHGAVRVTPASGPPLVISRGATAVVAHAAGPPAIDGDGIVLICRPPRPAL